MSGKRRQLTAEESAEYRADAGTRRKLSEQEAAQFAASGEAGAPGHDPYAAGPYAHQDTSPSTPRGTPLDAVKTWANTAALHAGPQIAGAMGAVMHAATNPMQQGTSDLDAYRDVRDETARQLAASENTQMGEIAKPFGVLATPIPVSPAKGMTAGQRAWQGAKVGGATQAIEGLATAKGDLTKLDGGEWKNALANALGRGVIGAGGGALAGPFLGKTQSAAKATAEEQALRAAGLQAGIKNSIRKDLGLADMDEARALGRRFLDEDLIPAVGSSEAVAKRAQRLEGEAGQTIGSVLNKADVATMSAPQRAAGQTSAGRPSNVTQPTPGFDYEAMGNAAHGVLDDASAPADLMSGAKARQLADAFKAQAERTPGSFVGANKAKSDAWKSARFDQDAPMSAQLYRKAVGAGRDDIERQVAAALGPEDAAALKGANEKFGVAADALKLAENESTRRAARKGVTMGDVLALTTGGAAGGFSGHPGLGVGGGLALALGAKGYDKYGHSSTARFADWLAKRAGKNTGGVVGGEVATTAADALAPYLDVLKEEQ
jgi:hypothetical protein